MRDSRPAKCAYKKLDNLEAGILVPCSCNCRIRSSLLVTPTIPTGTFEPLSGSSRPTPRLRDDFMPNTNVEDVIRKAQQAIDESRAIRAKVEQTRNKVMQSTNRHAQLMAQLRKRSTPN